MLRGLSEMARKRDLSRRFRDLIVPSNRDFQPRADLAGVFALVFDNLVQGILVFDADLRLMFFNRRYVELFEYPSGFLRAGLSYEDVLRFNIARGEYGVVDAERFVQERIKARRDASRSERHEHVRPNGKILGVHKTFIPGGGFINTYINITRRKRQENQLREEKERAEEAGRAKSAFLANMSHELRTPLNAIIGFAQLIASESLGPVGPKRYLEYAADIESSGAHLLRTITDILDLSKVEAGKMELHKEVVHLRDLFEFCRKMFDERAKAAGIELSSHVDDGLTCVFADEQKLRQSILNLLANAVKFTPAGGKVELLGKVSEEGINIVVTDTGIGMAESDIPKALTPFAQIDNTFTRRFEGTGLGLPLADSFARLHGGSIRISSKPGKGTSVVLSLPASVSGLRIGVTEAHDQREILA